MINVLSLFDGFSGARIALDQLGVKCNYYAFEIDKYAIKIAMKNYPDTIQLGNVKNVKYRDGTLFHNFGTNQIPQIDLFIGGSPCQDLSIAKKDRAGLNGLRSCLFYEYVRLLKECKPKYFLLENVNSMDRKNKQIITRNLDVLPIMINSALLTAQNRERLYWTNIKTEKYTLFGDMKTTIKQPKDKHIYLKDILDHNISKFYGLWSDHNKSIVFNKSRTIEAGCGVTGNATQQDVISKPVRIGKIGKGGQGDRVYSIKGKSVSLSAEAKTGLYLIKGVAKRTRNHKGKQLEIRKDKKANALTSVQTDSMLSVKDYIRKLTPLECERLQGIPDNYTKGVSNTQRYKMIGNGFTVPVIKYILSFVNFGGK